MDFTWNPSQALTDLQQACILLSERGLKISAKWAAEQCVGLQEQQYASAECSIDQDFSLFDATQHSNVYYAKSLLDLGEYAHAAFVLSRQSSAFRDVVDVMPPPMHNLSPGAYYLRAYALYMAGERKKEEDDDDDEDDADQEKPPKLTVGRNPFLSQLAEELQSAFETELLDPFGLYVYGMVLLGQKNFSSAAKILIQSLNKFVWNWSAWVDLATCCVNLQSTTEWSDLEQELEDQFGPSSHLQHTAPYMYHFFCAYLQSEQQAHGEALVVYERWLELWGPSPYLQTQYAFSHYHLRNFPAARRVLQDLHQLRPYRLDGMDIYSNILYVQEDSVALCQLAHTATQVDKYRSETCFIIGNYYSSKEQRAKAIEYFQHALQIDRTCVGAWTLLGHECVEWKQTTQAMDAYRRAIAVAPNDFRAWYGLGQTYEFMNLHLHALYYYQQAVQLRPYDARMWCALGTTLTHLHRPNDAILAYERAWQYDDPEGVATQKLAKLYWHKEEHDKAAQCYMRHLETRYHITTEESKHPNEVVTLDTMLQGLVVEALEAEALMFLAMYHKKQGDYDVSALLASRLLEYPGPEKEQAKALLRELKSRKSRRKPTQPSSGKQGPWGSFEFSP